MQIGGLMHIKNESYFLRQLLPKTIRLVDRMLILDTGSTDDSLKILQDLNVEVRKCRNTGLRYKDWRNELLEWAREEEITYQLYIDADECFSDNVSYDDLHFLASSLEPGQRLALEWITVWKNKLNMRIDQPWGSNYKDFIFHDDGISVFTSESPHGGRTPGVNRIDSWKVIKSDRAAMLHFQFLPFEAAQIKQCWKRCTDLISGGNPASINRMYYCTLDGLNVKVARIPDGLVPSYSFSDNIEMERVCTHTWYLDSMISLFDYYGIEFFERLDIWHADVLRREFYYRTKRYPRRNRLYIFIWTIGEAIKSGMPISIMVCLSFLKKCFIIDHIARLWGIWKKGK